jgi:CheY-like chemotaxis protein
MIWQSVCFGVDDYYIMLSYKILVAEDDAFTAQIISNTFDILGIEHTVVHNGEEALKEITYDFYDLVLMDIQMPILDGISASKRMRKLSNTTPIIAFTSCNFEEIKHELKAAGINNFLGKPSKLNQLPFQLLKYFKQVA